MNNIFFYSMWMLIAGLGIPIMAALNSSLGIRLQSPALAASLLFFVGLIISLLYLFFSGGLVKISYLKNIPWYLFCGGFLVMFYILSVTYVSPYFGVANTLSFILLGQLITMSIIDHYGFMGMQQYLLNVQRLLGLFLMAIGILLVNQSVSETE